MVVINEDRVLGKGTRVVREMCADVGLFRLNGSLHCLKLVFRGKSSVAGSLVSTAFWMLAYQFVGRDPEVVCWYSGRGGGRNVDGLRFRSVGVLGR